MVFDAIAVHALRKTGADRLLTLNRKDILRVWPEGAAAVER